MPWFTKSVVIKRYWCIIRLKRPFAALYERTRKSNTRHVLFVGVHKHFAGATWVELRSSITFIMMYLLYCCVADIMSVQLSCIEARTRTLTDFPGNSSLAIRLMPRPFGTNAHGSLPTRMCQGVCSIPFQDYSVRVGLRLLIFEGGFKQQHDDDSDYVYKFGTSDELVTRRISLLRSHTNVDQPRAQR
jgi:hypothetical protein